MTSWQFWIDRGGTFTDIVARDPSGALHARKLLSEDPGHYEDAALEGIRRLLAEAGTPDAPIEAVKMGTTVATNALLTRSGARTALLITQGFADLPRIGNQARPHLFQLNIRRPEPLFERVFEIPGRLGVDGAEIVPLDTGAARAALAAAKAAGIEAVAISLLHAWKYPGHEQALAGLARAAGFTQVSVSHEASPALRLVPRTDTTVADAYLSPPLARYVRRVASGLRAGTPLYFMQSHGGLADAAFFTGKDAILSGPAGGLVGAARTAEAAGFPRMIGFDMGGTSTDVSLYDDGFEQRVETEIAGVRLRAPMLAINTVAAGGGSVLGFEQGRLRAGPDSAGADPGPLCYRRGGPLTVTDANLCLGKIFAPHFPAIFGPDGDEPLDAEGARAAFADLARRVAAETGTGRGPEELAEGFIRIAVASMAHAIRQISVQRGVDPAGFALASFGGAGGQHACLVAEELGMDTVFIHPLAGVLSAYGIGLADLAAQRERAAELPPDDPALAGIAAALTADAEAALIAQGAKRGAIATSIGLRIRYAGTDTALTVPHAEAGAMRAAFEAAHRRLFGFVMDGQPLVVETVVAEAHAGGEPIAEPALAARAHGKPEPVESIRLFSGGAHHDAPIYKRDTLLAGDVLQGPAMIAEANATTIVEPGWRAEITPANGLVLRHTAAAKAPAAADHARPDPVHLELFANLFMAIAEHCGVVLRNTARSVNIKERLDFSCALFDAEGGLVANAPHVPVHLGAMGGSVRAVIAARGATLRPGDAVALNDPYRGGTHLPDITVVTPVFDEAGAAIRFFVASRGHHADIGGLTPGSTPPDARTLEEEGVVITDFLLLEGGRLREAELRALLTGARYPARDPEQNIADLKAQLAANAAGVEALQAAIARHGWPMVRAYMGHVMDNAEEAVRRAIGRLKDSEFHTVLDDGSPLAVAIRVDRAARVATIDFTGTGKQDARNFNAPTAVTRSAVLYCFRCLVDADIPLNEGCLKPLTLVIPEGSFLAPAPGSAVVAGNTEVSQLVTSALLAALGVSAAGQSTMNNVLFGNDRVQYYETICGGAGAGIGADGGGYAGASAVHTNMTNTRITDPEVLELRYPVRLEEFSIRAGSGGGGRFPGGNGAVRRFRFLEAVTATIAASNRETAPYGLAGGGDAAPGRQWIERADGTTEPLGGRATAELAPGDALVIETPGGGGYGPP